MVANSTVAAVVPAGAGGETTTFLEAEIKEEREPDAARDRLVTLIVGDAPEELSEAALVDCVIADVLVEARISLK